MREEEKEREGEREKEKRKWKEGRERRDPLERERGTSGNDHCIDLELGVSEERDRKKRNIYEGEKRQEREGEREAEGERRLGDKVLNDGNFFLDIFPADDCQHISTDQSIPTHLPSHISPYNLHLSLILLSSPYFLPIDTHLQAAAAQGRRVPPQRRRAPSS